MVSFRNRFISGLTARGIPVSVDITNAENEAVLVIGGTRDLFGLWQARRRGTRIVQRLNGMNWLHRHLNTGVKHYLRAEYGNLILRTIRARLADHIVYQSEFARDWWTSTFGETSGLNSIVYNAVDTTQYNPQPTPSTHLPANCFRVLLVEGSLMGGYELGLETAVKLVETLDVAYSQHLAHPVELMVAGKVSEQVKDHWAERTDIHLVWAGLVPADQIPDFDRSAHLLYSADINAACPNAVIEAMACGLPILAFDTGALPELVAGTAGRIVPYGTNPWKLETPDIDSLASAAVDILMNQDKFRRGARDRAVANFDLEPMVNKYLDSLLYSTS
jgi:glycosyltransferase involved in cell wall biosynthesis